MATNGFLTVTDDVRHTYEQVFYGRQLTGNNAEPDASPLGPWTPPDPSAPASPEATGLNGEVLGPEGPAGGPTDAPQLEGLIIEGSGTVHDHAGFYGTIWGDGGAPSIDAPEIEAPAISPPDQGDDLTPGY